MQKISFTIGIRTDHTNKRGKKRRIYNVVYK